MMISLEDLNIGSIIEAACVQTLNKSLAKELPQIVGTMLKSGNNILKRTFDIAIEVEVVKCVNAFVLDHEDEIHKAVTDKMNELMSAETISAAVVSHLSSIKMPAMKLFTPKVKHVDPDDEDYDGL